MVRELDCQTLPQAFANIIVFHKMLMYEGWPGGGEEWALLESTDVQGVACQIPLMYQRASKGAIKNFDVHF